MSRVSYTVRFHSTRAEYTRLLMVALMCGILGALAMRVADARQLAQCVGALDTARHVVEETTMKLGAKRCK